MTCWLSGERSLPFGLLVTFRHQNVRTDFQHFVITGVQPISSVTAALGVYPPTLRKYLAALF